MRDAVTAGETALTLEARYRRWMEAGPAYQRGDLERLRAFRPQFSPMAVYVHVAMEGMRRG